MRFIEYLAEASANYGIVITVDKSSGNFEDMELYDIDNDKIHPGQDHAQNMFNSIVHEFREEENWNQAAAFFKKYSKRSKMMGSDYSDDEGLTNILYGPFSIDELGHLTDSFEREFVDQDAKDNWDTDDRKSAEFERTEARSINRGR